MLVNLKLLLFLAQAFAPEATLRGPSSVFWRGDGYSGSEFACKSAALRWLGSSELRNDLPVIATRGKQKPIPCGSTVAVWNLRTGRIALAVKLDTGPVGRDLSGVFKYVADLMPRVA